MAAKTLSTSTLSLKFMQNAHRAKNLAEVQLEKAEVKDDGEWEVAQEIRDAWGPESTHAVSYEASYLPFLFADDAPSPTAKGRRAFKRGREVADDYQAVEAAAPAPPAASTSKPAGKLRSISSTLSGRAAPKKTNPTSKAPKGKSAREAIYDSAGVGADLRQNKNSGPPPPAPPPVAPPPPVFLKPAGVDEPAPAPAKLKPKTADDLPAQKPKGKRARDAAAESGEGETSKKKKKKKKEEQTD